MDVTCRKSKIAANIFLTYVEPQMVIVALVINPFGKKFLRNAREKNKKFDIRNKNCDENSIIQSLYPIF